MITPSLLVTRHERAAARTLSQSRQYAVHGLVGLKYVVYATILKICRIMGRSFRYILKSLNPHPKIRSILYTNSLRILNYPEKLPDFSPNKLSSVSGF